MPTNKLLIQLEKQLKTHLEEGVSIKIDIATLKTEVKNLNGWAKTSVGLNVAVFVAMVGAILKYASR